MFNDSKLRAGETALLCIALLFVLFANAIGLAFLFGGANAVFFGGPLSLGESVGFGTPLVVVLTVVLLWAGSSDSDGRDELLLAASIVGGGLLFWNGLAWLPVIGTPSFEADLAFALLLVCIELAIWLMPALRTRLVAPIEMLRQTVHMTSSFTPGGFVRHTHSVSHRERRGSRGSR